MCYPTKFCFHNVSFSVLFLYLTGNNEGETFLLAVMTDMVGNTEGNRRCSYFVKRGRGEFIPRKRMTTEKEKKQQQ